MAFEAEKTIPIKKDLWRQKEGALLLLASQCLSCEEVFFPRKEAGAICSHCQSRELQQIDVEGKGTITSFTVSYQQPAGGFYQGPVPYAFGFVKLKDLKVETLFTGCDLEDLEVGMDVEMVLEKLSEDEEGNEIITYKFQPVYQ